MRRFSPTRTTLKIMETQLTPVDERALAAKADNATGSELFGEVRGLIAKEVMRWRKFDADDQDGFIGEIFVAAVRKFEVGRAPFLAYLAAYAKFFMLTQERKRLRCKSVFNEEMLSLNFDDGETSFRNQAVSPDPGPEEVAEGNELREVIDAAIAAFTDRPKVRRLLTRVILEGHAVSAAATEAGLGISRAKLLRREFLDFAAGYSRLRDYREDA